ncbi:hypothetical protein TELCIR_05170 [Teladorsagia circumcincta]|uniref:Integrase catalytic domain-containing protein n=1 Tax=Teladorsagia circumcincta TaxID=45464 RepID=A0A2G9URI7_TELCI|nr:hypothetical protein TELCIR_05170 [Teladorsagia circumcincta]
MRIPSGQMSSIFSTATIQVMKDIFTKFENPTTLVTDNGTKFTSSQFALFCRSRGINHIRTPPFHPQSNGQAERFVDTFKRGLAKLKGEEPTVDALQTFLMAYRSTPCPWACGWERLDSIRSKCQSGHEDYLDSIEDAEKAPPMVWTCAKVTVHPIRTAMGVEAQCKRPKEASKKRWRDVIKKDFTEIPRQKMPWIGQYGDGRQE